MARASVVGFKVNDRALAASIAQAVVELGADAEVERQTQTEQLAAAIVEATPVAAAAEHEAAHPGSPHLVDAIEPGPGGVYIDQRAFWWRFLEFGHGLGKKGHSVMNARPFIRPVLELFNGRRITSSQERKQAQRRMGLRK